jgi:hypothetical protein
MMKAGFLLFLEKLNLSNFRMMMQGCKLFFTTSPKETISLRKLHQIHLLFPVLESTAGHIVLASKSISLEVKFIFRVLLHYIIPIVYFIYAINFRPNAIGFIFITQNLNS